MNARDIGGAALLSVLVVGVVAGIVQLTMLQEQQRAEVEKFCTDAHLSAHNIMLVDRTDPHTAEQAAVLKAQIGAVATALPVGGKLSLIEFSATGAELDPPLFSDCRPKRGEDVNWKTGNPPIVQEAYEASFGIPVGNKSTELEVPASDMHSPIMQAIKAITDLPDFQSQVAARTLTVFSDLLEHTEQYSQYSKSAVLDFDRFRTMTYAADMIPDLSGVNVVILYRHNAKAAKYQTERHLDFWKRWFLAAGAKSITVEVVP